MNRHTLTAFLPLLVGCSVEIGAASRDPKMIVGACYEMAPGYSLRILSIGDYSYRIQMFNSWVNSTVPFREARGWDRIDCPERFKK